MSVVLGRWPSEADDINSIIDAMLDAGEPDYAPLGPPPAPVPGLVAMLHPKAWPALPRRECCDRCGHGVTEQGCTGRCPCHQPTASDRFVEYVQALAGYSGRALHVTRLDTNWLLVTLEPQPEPLEYAAIVHPDGRWQITALS